MTTSVGVSPGPVTTVPAVRRAWWRPRLDGRTTPARLRYWTDCLVLLQQGDVTAISTDDSILDGLAAQDPWTMIIGPQLTSEPYGLAISKQHPEFVRFVNAVLEQLRTDGQWKSIYTRWLGSPAKDPPPAKYAG